MVNSATAGPKGGRSCREKALLPDSDPEIALNGVPAKVQPHGPLQSGRRCVETSGDVINEIFT